jgi:hypothetical protein
MGKIVLLAVAAAWAAVLIPPLIRSRVENRPNSSVTDFRRQLSTLQRTVPARGMAPMRSIGRPLTQAPSARTASRQGSAVQRSSSGAGRGHLHVASLDRPAASRTHATVAARRPSPREVRRRRRANVLFLLVVSFALTLFLFATSKSDAMMYAFVLSFFSLMGYCYKLIQLRNRELDGRHTPDNRWYHAA